MHLIDKVPQDVQLTAISSSQPMTDEAGKPLAPWGMADVFQELVVRHATPTTWGKGREAAKTVKRLAAAFRGARAGEPLELESADAEKLIKFVDTCETWPMAIAAQCADHLDAMAGAREKK
jgi:hypothetical protein